MTNSVSPNQYVSDSNGFVYPRFGGNVATMRGTFAYTDTTATTLFTLPAGSVVIDYWYDVTTASDAGTTGVVDIGLSTDPDGLVDGGDVTALGRIRAGANATDLVTALNNTPLTQETTVTGSYAETGTEATEGEFTFSVLYTREEIA